jgi:hypothetical protein
VRVVCVAAKMRQRVWPMSHQPAKTCINMRVHAVRACVRACVQSLLIGGDNCALSTLSTTPCQRRGQPLATGLITRIERPAGRATP